MIPTIIHALNALILLCMTWYYLSRVLDQKTEVKELRKRIELLEVRLRNVCENGDKIILQLVEARRRIKQLEHPEQKENDE